MLRVEKTTLGTFGEPELAGLINSRGWKSVSPDALDDQHLLETLQAVALIEALLECVVMS